MDETQAPQGGDTGSKQSGSPVMSIVVVVIILALGAFFMLRNKPATDTGVENVGTDVNVNVNIDNTTATTTPAVTSTVTATSTITTTSAVKEFTVTGKNFSYDLKTLEVNKGDKVRIIFKNADGLHDLKIDEFAVATKQIAAGTQEVVEFIASKSGSFEYYCSVGQHRANGMVGTLTVK
jgi:plastocyanin